MIRINSPFGKSVSVACTFALVFCMVPSMAWAKTYSDASTWVKSKLPKPPLVLGASKILSSAKMKAIQGKGGENPYAAGQSKWDVVYRGVNLLTGNYSMNATDLTFEGGYGIPVNVTRSYSANDAEEGPFGKGWSMSADVRSTAGGMMKSGGAPVRAVPVNFKERPTTQLCDPNAATADGSQVQPIQAVTATDSGGQEETIQRDADGILSTPPWDKNKIDSEFETVIGSDGTNYQVMKKNWVNTPEGTVYVYEKQGAYVGPSSSPFGMKPCDDSSAAAEPSNVLKISTATDRHGNVTSYTYGSGYVSFSKSNGTTSEHPLTKVHMPNGHEINFVWGSGATANRIVEINDGVRHVYYAYTSSLLTSVTTPGGKVTTMTYAAPQYASGWTDEVAGPVLRTVTDPRGLTTTLYSCMKYGYLSPLHYGNIYAMQPSVTTYRINQPNGVDVWFDRDESGIPVDDPNDGFESGSLAAPWWSEQVGSTSINHGFIRFVPSSTTLKVMTGMAEVDKYGWSGFALVYPGMDSWKEYDIDTQNLVAEHHVTRAYVAAQGAINTGRKLHYSDLNESWTDSTTTYNFLGNPLEKTSSSTKKLTDTSTTTESYQVSHSYWGANKYYQQKAIQDQAGRYSFNDYYDNTAATGKKGQTYKVYDGARSTFYEDSGIPIPTSVPACPTDKYWKYRLTPTSDTYSAKFDYDSKGRATDVWKIQKTTTTPWTYVRTNTSYGADTDGSWGQANQVVEDYGGINRTTNTLQYDSIGRATKVQDSSGKVFLTNYDLDGVVQSIDKIVSSTATPVVTYTYGTTGLTNGAVLSVTDNLSGVAQSMSYVSSGVAIGNISSVTETNGSDSYTTSYSYNSTGDRSVATYTTQSALGLSTTTKWKYSDYIQVGEPTSGTRVFSTLTALDSSSDAMTSEQFHYVYDSQGRPVDATFAMTPQSWTPSSGASYYDESHRATTRGRTHYDYDAGGRVKGVYNWWDTWNSGSSSYSSTPIRANECVYETTGLKRGLKTQNKFYNVSGGSWNLQRTESYGYDANLDYLTSANYGDGLSNATPSWTYDAAGNRASDSTNSGTWTYDNLNRMTASPGYTYTNDNLGNRTGKTNTSTSSASSYSWDVLNRMTGINSGEATPPSYMYRADGLRVSKALSSGSTLYRYDGQIGVEDVEKNTSGTITSVTRNALGCRAIDAVSRTTSSGTTVTYPLYDAHGNNVGMLAKSGSTWSLNDERTYDAWGNVRSGGSTGDQKGRYCANLGHKQDDESGLVYMRARYYESISGRFISQDPAMDGFNFFLYCNNDPVNHADATGKIRFTVDGYTFRFDTNLFEDGDLHIFKDGKPVLARKADGTARHIRSLVGNGEWTRDMFKALQRAALSGNESAMQLYEKVMAAEGKFGVPEKFHKKAFGPAYTSVDAYAIQEPEDFIDIIRTIAGGGK